MNDVSTKTLRSHTSKKKNILSISSSTLNKLFICSGVALLFGGIYYLYKKLSQNEELSEDLLIEIEEISQQIEEHNGYLSTDIAVKILMQINRLADSCLKKDHPIFFPENRKNKDNEEEKLYYDYIQLKEEYHFKASQIILKQYKMKLEDFYQIIQELSPYEIEAKSYSHFKPVFSDSEIPDRQKAKEAYIFYGHKFTNEIIVFQQSITDLEKEIKNKGEDFIAKKFIALKLKLDDVLLEAYGVTESQLRYLIFEYNLLEDKEVKATHDNILNYDKFYG